MFTGIVTQRGEVSSASRRRDGLRLSVRIARLNGGRLKVGRSLCVNGVCLTVARARGSVAEFDVVRETLLRSTLGVLKTGDPVNVEPSLRVGDEVGGHFVMGHVDGVGTVVAFRRRGGAAEMTVEVPADLRGAIFEKGSIAFDGVSLTVARVSGRSVAVALIPFTLAHTTLGAKREGDRVNLEVDILARYVQRIRRGL